jgi:hypothetical protein
MKKAGIVILIVGLLITIITGIKFITKEKVLEIGELEITRDKSHNLAWSPLIGLAVMVVGGGMYLFGPKKN